MKPHPRIRKTIKWGGAAATLLLVAVWIGSGWHSLYWASQSGVVLQATGGRLMIQFYKHPEVPEPCGLVWGGAGPFWLAWSPRWADTPFWREAFVPLWIPAVLTLGLTAAAWRLDSRTRRRAHMNI